MTLPNELIYRIVSYLPKDTSKKNWDRVNDFCRLIDSTRVHKPFSRITIDSEHYLKTIELLFEQPQSQVQTLLLKNTDAKVGPARVMDLLKRFPNLQEFDWVHGLTNKKQNLDSVYKTQEYSVNEEKANYCKSITVFRETSSHFLSTQVMAYGRFCNLIELDINYIGASAKCDVLIEHISKAPKLKILKLCGYRLASCDLAALFKNAPKLDTLYLQDPISRQILTFRADAGSLVLKCALVDIPDWFENANEFNWTEVKEHRVDTAINIKWWESTTVFQERSPYFLSIQILTYGEFSNLIDLDVEFFGRCDALVELLSKAPKLKILKLRRCQMAVLDLAMLHNKTPLLETLHLDHINPIEIEGEQVVPNPRSSEKLTELIIDGRPEIFNGYIQGQYKNLKKFRVKDPSLDAELAKSSRYLESYKFMKCGVTTEILEEMAQLKEVEIIRTSNEIKLLGDSKQSSSLETIKIDTYLQNDMAYLQGDLTYLQDVVPWETFQKFGNLKHFEISSEQKEHIPLDELLKNAKHLKTLTLNNVKIKSAEKDNDAFESNLETLIITGNYDQRVISFLSKSCTKVTNLTITYEEVNLIFPQNNFASISFGYYDGAYYNLENTLKGQSVCCHYNRSENSLTFMDHLPATIKKNNAYTAYTTKKSDKRISIVYASCASLWLGNSFVPDCHL